MKNLLSELLRDEGVALGVPIPLSLCRTSREYKLTRAGFSDLSALTVYMLAVPYRTKGEDGNLSRYAHGRDYHGYFAALFSRILPVLREQYPTACFAGFADDSPIDERDAGAKAGLGVLGDNGLLITPLYSSFVFLGEIVTDLPHECYPTPFPVGHCEGCGACRTACPSKKAGAECLSALTQKKGELNAEEIALIKKNGSAWGCDACQEVCPHTLRALRDETIYTSVPYFTENTLPYLSTDALDAMPQEEFSKRAYAWRGRPTIRRNLLLLEEDGQK